MKTPKRKSTVAMLLSVGIGMALVAILSLAWTFSSSTQQLHQITRDLYTHPFLVSNAAASLKVSLYQMRSATLQIGLMATQRVDIEKLAREIEAYDHQARRDIEAIKQNFLGDISKVSELETKVNEWHDIRMHILDAVRKGDAATAEEIIATQGSPKFDEIAELAEYILSFAKDRAKQYVQEGDDKANQLIGDGNRLSIFLLGVFILTSYLVVWRILTLQKELDNQATTDMLTGVVNRRQFFNHVDLQIRRAKRYGEIFSFVLVDLDFFKAVNDTYGHATGDKVLQNFCIICRNTMRRADIIGRLGGEEFGILLLNTKPDDAREVIDRLRRLVHDTAMQIDGNEVRITASFGIAGLKQETIESSSADDLFKCADEALYQAKHNGRNQVSVYVC